LYSEIDKKIRHIVYVRHENKGGYDEVSFMFRYQRINTVALITRALMYDGMDKERFGILPSSIPFRGQVICVFPPLREYRMEDMIIRAQQCLEHRYHYLNSHEIWPLRDKYSAQCGYKDKIIFPRKVRTLGSLYARYHTKKDAYEPVGCAVIDQGYAIKYLIEMVQDAEDKEFFFRGMLQSWKENISYWHDIWVERGYLLSDLFRLLINHDDSLTSPLLRAMTNLERERDKINIIYVQHPPKDKTNYQRYQGVDERKERQKLLGEDFPDLYEEEN